MKFLKSILPFLVVISLTLSGCGVASIQISKIDEVASKKVASKFIRAIFNIDTTQINEYLDVLDSFGSKAGNQKFISKVNSYDKRIIPLLIQSAYKDIVDKRLNFLNVNCCLINKCTMQMTNLTFKNQFYDEKLKKVGYYFDLKLGFKFNKDSKEYTSEASGEIYLDNQNGIWIINGYVPYAKSYKLSNSRILELYS